VRRWEGALDTLNLHSWYYNELSKFAVGPNKLTRVGQLQLGLPAVRVSKWMLLPTHPGLAPAADQQAAAIPPQGEVVQCLKDYGKITLDARDSRARRLKAANRRRKRKPDEASSRSEAEGAESEQSE
jgi:hypothetical protein